VEEVPAVKLHTQLLLFPTVVIMVAEGARAAQRHITTAKAAAVQSVLFGLAPAHFRQQIPAIFN
jgi:hypothetical protein